MSDAWQQWHTAKVSGQFSKPIEEPQEELAAPLEPKKEPKMKRDWFLFFLMVATIILNLVLTYMLFTKKPQENTAQPVKQQFKYADIVREFFKTPMVPGQKRRLRLSIRSCAGKTDKVESHQLTKL